MDTTLQPPTICRKKNGRKTLANQINLDSDFVPLRLHQSDVVNIYDIFLLLAYVTILSQPRCFTFDCSQSQMKVCTWRRAAASAASALQRVHIPSRLHVLQARCGMTGGGMSTRAATGVHHDGGTRYRTLISCESCSGIRFEIGGGQGRQRRGRWGALNTSDRFDP